MHHFLTVWFDWVQQWGYFGVILLMAMESSITPVPSEIVIAPAAFMATQPGSQMTVWGVVLAGTFGSWLGAAITYWVSRSVGRVIVLKFGRYLMISEKKLELAEHWVHRYEAGGIFFARLLPMVRHLISIPAGIIRMDFGIFSLMTVAGSAVWCTVLAVYGQRVLGDYARIHPDWMKDPAGLVGFMKSQSHLLLGGIVVLCVLYFLVLKLTAKREENYEL